MAAVPKPLPVDLPWDPPASHASSPPGTQRQQRSRARSKFVAAGVPEGQWPEWLQPRVTPGGNAPAVTPSRPVTPPVTAPVTPVTPTVTEGPKAVTGKAQVFMKPRKKTASRVTRDKVISFPRGGVTPSVTQSVTPPVTGTVTSPVHPLLRTPIMVGLALGLLLVSLGIGLRNWDTLVLTGIAPASAAVTSGMLVVFAWVLGWALELSAYFKRWVIAWIFASVLVAGGIAEIWLNGMNTQMSIARDVKAILAEKAPACTFTPGKDRDVYGYSKDKTQAILDDAKDARQSVERQHDKCISEWNVDRDARVAEARKRPDSWDHLSQLMAAIGTVLVAFFIPVIARIEPRGGHASGRP